MNILRRISVVALCASFFYRVDGQATCALSWENGTVLPDSNWNFGYILAGVEDVTPAGTVLLNMTASSIASISTTVVDSDSGYIFMQPSLSNGHFTLTLTDHFAQYEELETTTSILVTVTFVCSVNTRSLEIYQPVIDTNNHYPEFQNAPYVYELPMPFPAGFSVQLFGSISARDIDLTNTNISFTLNSSDPNSAGFSASWLSQDVSDTKLHLAQLLSTALLNIENDVIFNIYATDNGVPSLTSVTNVTISVDEENSVPTSPMFEYPLYVADHSELTIEEASGTSIAFDRGNVSLRQGVSSTVEYSIVDNTGNYENNFVINVSENYGYVSISLRNVTDELLAERYVILTLTATRSGAENTGVTILHIALPGIICPVATTTECSTTTVEQTTTGSTQLTNVTEQTTTVSECPEIVECTTTTTEYITVTECPTIATTECPEVTNCPTIATTECPEVTNCPTIATTECPEVTNCPTIATTECPRVTDCPTIATTECPVLTTEQCSCDCSTTTVPTVAGNSTVTAESITIGSTEAITECPVVTVTQECDCADTTAAWTSATTEEANTVLTTTSGATLPTTTDSSTQSVTSITTTMTAITPSLGFSSSVYIFEKDSSFTGVLMTQTAVAVNTDGKILYSTSFDDDDLSSRILINPNTAELQVTATIDPGTHAFKIVATIEELSLNASATVVLIVSALMTECSDEVVFGYALQMIELEEESVHENVLPLDGDGCSYTIYSQTPSQDLFYIDDNRLNTIAIDREALYFSNMTVAQVRVIIDVSCSNGTSNATATATARAKRDTVYEVLTDNIPYVRTRTILIAVITDINDNPPLWSSDKPTHIGFPGYDLARLINVRCVYEFSATDADIDDNAIVRYGLSNGSDEYFYVHNSAGTLYIRQGVYAEDGFEITLKATDGIFDRPTNVVVRTLESRNIVVLFVDGGVLEDVTDILEDLRKIAGYWIQSLDSSVISESDTSSSSKLGYGSSRSISQRTEVDADPRPTLLRLVIYGLNNDEPVPSETLISTFRDSSVNWDIAELVTLESILSTSAETAAVESTDTRGLWAAIIVLLLLLVLLLIAAGVFYHLFSRRRNKPTSVESDVTYENFDGSQPNGNPTNLLVNSVTLGESQDHVTSPQLSKRKSVAFNNTVEEIEVARL